MPAETTSRPSARERILAAATEVARTDGAGNLSLDAIAAQAGVSKGGLLYHFPNKNALLRALVETFISDFEKKLADSPAGEPMLARYVDLALDEYETVKPGASGVVAAMAEDPDFLKPLRTFQRRLLDLLTQDAQDQGLALIVFLAIEGLRSQRLFDLKVLTREELVAVASTLQRLSRATT